MIELDYLLLFGHLLSKHSRNVPFRIIILDWDGEGKSSS